MKSVCFLLISSMCLISPIFSLAEQTSQVIDRNAINSRTHRTWEGIYTYSEERIIRIENQKNLHILIYKCEGFEGMLIDFAILENDSALKILKSADTSIKGVTPVLESIDVLVGEEGSEVIVRWKHPGQGGLRSIAKYYYESNAVELIDQSHLIYKTNGNTWIGQRSSERSTPAKLINHKSLQGES